VNVINDGFGPLLLRDPLIALNTLILHFQDRVTTHRDHSCRSEGEWWRSQEMFSRQEGEPRGSILCQSRFCSFEDITEPLWDQRLRISSRHGSLCRYLLPESDERRNWDLGILCFLHWE